LVKTLQAREWYVLDCDVVKHVTDDAGKSGEFERFLTETLIPEGFENGSSVATLTPKIDSRLGCGPPRLRKSIQGLDAGHLDSENRFKVWMRATLTPKIDSRSGCRPPRLRKSIQGLDAGHLDSENRFTVWMQATLTPKIDSRFGCG